MASAVLTGVGYFAKTIFKLTGYIFKGSGWYISNTILALKREKNDSKGKHSIVGEIF